MGRSEKVYGGRLLYDESCGRIARRFTRSLHLPRSTTLLGMLLSRPACLQG